MALAISPKSVSALSASDGNGNGKEQEALYKK
jgi:hypothetical protein